LEVAVRVALQMALEATATIPYLALLLAPEAAKAALAAARLEQQAVLAVVLRQGQRGTLVIRHR
jgi:hypothetical protein